MNETKTKNHISDKQWMSIRGNIKLAVSEASGKAHADSSYWLITLLDNSMRLADQYCHPEPDRVDEARKCLLAMAKIKLPEEPEPKIQMEVTVGDGKYTVVQRENGNLEARRHGMLWRDCTGDGLIYQLAAEVASLRGQLNVIRQSGSDRDIAMEYGRRESFVHAVTCRGFPTNHPAAGDNTHSMYSNRSRAEEVRDQLNQHRQDNNPYKVQSWLVIK